MGDLVYVIIDADCGGPVAVCGDEDCLQARLAIFRREFPHSNFESRTFRTWTGTDLEYLQGWLVE